MPLAPHLAPFRAWLVEVERAWLGWSFAPPERVLAASRWRPDHPSAYCGRCGGSVGHGEVTARGCGACRGTRLAVDGVVRLGPYTGSMSEWVCAIKYQRWGEMAESLGRLLGQALARRLGMRPGARTEGVLLVPMPMPWQRRIYRGIDHAALIAAAAADAVGAASRPLLAAENGPPQVSVAGGMRGGRLTPIRLRRTARKWTLEGLDVVLVDDVRTSGASLAAAARLLRGLGPRRLLAAVLSVADHPGRRGRAGARPGAAAGTAAGGPFSPV